MDSVTVINIVRDSLRTNLTDPRVTAGDTVSRTSSDWVFANEPHSSFKYPQIELLKIDNPTFPMTIGPDYWEFEQVFINIWFYTKNGFKLTVAGVEYSNAQLVEYYQGLIKTTLKAKFTTLETSGAKMFKHVNTSPTQYDPDTQLYFGNVTIRVAFFNNT
jgi:hypothetical protein